PARGAHALLGRFDAAKVDAGAPSRFRARHSRTHVFGDRMLDVLRDFVAQIGLGLIPPKESTQTKRDCARAHSASRLEESRDRGTPPFPFLFVSPELLSSLGRDPIILATAIVLR